MVELSVIIVNYNTPELVIDCLGSLIPELRGMDAGVVVVDNNSQDDSCEVIQSWVNTNAETAVTLIRSPENTGFSGGNNQGIKACAARHYLLLNSDTLIRPGAISTLLDTARTFPEAGIISPRLEDQHGVGQSSCFRSHSAWSELSSAAKTGIVDKLLAKYIVAMPPQESPMYPRWTSFACVLIRDDVFRQVGLLDESFFMYFEDAEFCDRVNRTRWKILHNPAAVVAHFHSKSSGIGEKDRLKKRLPRYFYESRSLYYYRRSGLSGLLLMNLAWYLGRSISLIRQILGRPDKSANQRMWLDIWINFLKCRRLQSNIEILDNQAG